jgi:hypothetical protein
MFIQDLLNGSLGAISLSYKIESLSAVAGFLSFPITSI